MLLHLHASVDLTLKLLRHLQRCIAAPSIPFVTLLSTSLVLFYHQTPFLTQDGRTARNRLRQQLGLSSL